MVEVSSMIPSSARIVINPVIHRRPAHEPQIGSLLQTLMPHPISLPPSNVLLLIKQPQPIIPEPPCDPLDLSCKSKSNLKIPPQAAPVVKLEPPPLPQPPVEPFAIRRANSCSTGSGLFSDEERRLKRKEQNKAAAQSYRQRKKSFSGLIETEFEMLTKRNVQLKAQKQKLEDHIQKIRGLLNEVAEDSKRNDEIISDTTSEPPMVQSPSWSMDGSSFACDEQQMRSRKNTWPMALSGKDRKKEQNKLASRRFRQRRKQEMTHCEHEVQLLEATNKRMKERCEELESKIKLLKDLMNKNNAMLSSKQKQVTLSGDLLQQNV